MLVAALLLASNPASAAEDLEIQQGSIGLGGSATARFVAGDREGFFLAVEPTGSYWLSSRLGILAGFTVTLDNGSLGLGVGGGAQYNFTDSGVRPYAGGALGAAAAGGTIAFQITGMGGVLVPMNRTVALDLGLRANFIVGDSLFVFDLPVGWLGVRAFVR